MTVIALIFVAIGWIALYLGSRNQRLLVTPINTLTAKTLGALMLLAGWFCLTTTMQKLPAIYMLVTASMFLGCLVPYLAAYFGIRKKD